MITTATRKTMPDTFLDKPSDFVGYTLTVPKADVNFFKTMAKKMGWTVERKKAAVKRGQSELACSAEREQSRTKFKAAKPRLYDPETGDYLNDATMKVIENARKGKDVIEVGSMDDYLKLVKNLTIADRHALRPVQQEEQTESKMSG